MTGRSITWRAGFGALLLGVPAALPSQTPAYQVYAVRYATLPSFPLSALLAGADTSRRTDIAMMVWLVRGGEGREVLVDAGFYREKFLKHWHPQDYLRPSDAVAAAGVVAGDVSDIIITHAHWDHLDGVDLFPTARVWIQRDEYAYYVNDDGSPRNRGIDPDDAAALKALERTGRLRLVPGDAQEILPGITCYTGGRHTYASQYVAVRGEAGTVVLASDNVYLYENLDRHVPIAQTFDAQANLAAQARMLTIASRPGLVVPGHDSAVLQRFPAVAPGIVRVR